MIYHQPVLGGKVTGLLLPLPLEIFLRYDVQYSQTGIEVAQQRNGAQRHVGLSHANFVGNIREALGGEQIVQSDSALKL